MDREYYIDELKEIKEKCKLKEPVIEYYAVCLLKISNVYKKIEESDMLCYVKQIVAPSFPLIMKYFLKSAEVYLNTENPETKVTLLNDIQSSVESYLEVWEIIIQSTNAADRILIQSVPVGSIRQVPAKICAYFASFLNALTRLFQKKEDSDADSDYAFLVYPSFGKRPESRLLFSTMQEKGKVGIIRIPEKDIWNVAYLRMLICHELFHIIPGDLRNRYGRAKALEKIITTDLAKRLWYDIEKNYGGKGRLGEWEKEKFEEIYFGEIPSEVNENYFSGKDKDDRAFYSTETLQFYSNYYILHLLKKLEISTDELWNKMYGSELPISTFAIYKQRMDALESCRIQMNKGILKLLAKSRLPKICSFYTDIFREVFSDLTFILSLKISAEEYFASFRYMPLQGNDFELVPGLYLRAGLILQIMTETDNFVSDAELFKKWVEWKKRLGKKENGLSFQEQVLKFLLLITKGKEDGKEDDSVSIVIYRSVWEHYLSHFLEYRNKYLKFEEEEKGDFEEFRKRYCVSLDVTNIQLLRAISKREWEFQI